MLHSKASKFAVLAAGFLSGFGITGSAQAQAFSATELGSLPGNGGDQATGINNFGQVVGYTNLDCSDDGCLTTYATEWRGGKVINLRGLPGTTFSTADAINNSGQVVGSSDARVGFRATERSGGKIMNLGALPGTAESLAAAINNSGQVVGNSTSASEDFSQATEWSHRKIISLAGLPGSIDSFADGVNDSGVVVGISRFGDFFRATEWKGGKTIYLGGLPGSSGSGALAITNPGGAGGYRASTTRSEATEWSDGKIIDLGRLTGSTSSVARAINNSGQVVGESVSLAHGFNESIGTLWSNGAVINLDAEAGIGGQFGVQVYADGVNDRGQIVLSLEGAMSQEWLLTPKSTAVPEPSTWVAMLLGSRASAMPAIAGQRRSARLLSPTECRRPRGGSRPRSCVSADRGRPGRGSPMRASPRSTVLGWATSPRSGNSRRAVRHEEVQRRGVDGFLQTHASAAGPRIHGPRHAGRAVERRRVEATHEAPESEDVEVVAFRQGEVVGQVDPKAAVEARAPADRQRAVLSR